MRIALTGATGLLGRNLVFEIIKQNLKNLSDLEIIILGRPSKHFSLKDRILKIIEDDGADYIGLPNKSKPETINEIAKHIIPITFELTKEKLNLSEADVKILRNNKIDFFFHLAALSDFRTDEITKKKLEVANIQGTEQVLKLISNLTIGELVYTGSAYACGTASGTLSPDYIPKNNSFHNYYEESKLLAEIKVRDYAKQKGLKHRIFRPVGIIGRLIESPIGSICKYDLFYEWAAFFFREKVEHLKIIEGVFNTKTDFPIRIVRNPKSSINLIAVDYAAKIMYAASIFNDPNTSYHLSSDEDIPHDIYLPLIFKELNISGIKLVEDEPKDKNNIEKLYYKTIGKIFTPYLLFKNPKFDNSNLNSLQKRANLLNPKINEDNFKKLLKYAKDHYFGLSYDHLKKLEAK